MSDKAYYNNILSGSRFISNLSRKARTDMYELFLKEMQPFPTSRILDIGVSVTGQDRVEENILEQLYPHPAQITMLGIHKGAFLEQVYPGTKYVQHSPGGSLPFSNDEFDVCYCNAVIEHVGEWESQQSYIQEILRVTRKLFLTTPNRAYPVDFHKFYPFLHWLPMSWYRQIISWMGDDFYSKKENLNLLYKSDLVQLFKDQGVPFQVYSYWWLGLPAHLIVVANKDATADSYKL